MEHKDVTQPTAGPTAVPTPAQLNSACMSYRHDFGLMEEDERERLRWSAKEWLHAWRKEFAVGSERSEVLIECLKYARHAIRYPWPFTGETLAHIDGVLSNDRLAAPKEPTP